MKSNFNEIIDCIHTIINEQEQILLDLSEEIITEKRNSQNRTIKELLGHLVDSASNNHQRMVRLQYKTNLDFPDYTQDNDLWIHIQKYQETDWYELVQLWKYFNLHIIHIIKSVDTSKLDNYWNDFEGNKVTLEDMLRGYLSHFKLHMRDIHELTSEYEN